MGGGAAAVGIWNITCLSNFILTLWLSWSAPRFGTMDKDPPWRDFLPRNYHGNLTHSRNSEYLAGISAGNKAFPRASLPLRNHLLATCRRVTRRCGDASETKARLLAITRMVSVWLLSRGESISKRGGSLNRAVSDHDSHFLGQDPVRSITIQKIQGFFATTLPFSHT